MATISKSEGLGIWLGVEDEESYDLRASHTLVIDRIKIITFHLIEQGLSEKSCNILWPLY